MVKKIGIILAAFVVVIAIVVLAFSCNSHRGSSDVLDLTSNAVSSEENTTDTLAEIAKYAVSISTPYAELSVSDVFDAAVKTVVKSEDPYVLEFVAKKDDTKLFSLHFNDETDDFLGTFKSGDKDVKVYVEFYEIKKDNEYYQKYTGYQMEVNTITAFLERDYGFTFGEKAEDAKPDTSVFDIKVNIENDSVTLKYPKKWEKKVTVEQGDKCVKFSAGDTPLFDLCFKDVEDGTQLGTYKDTPVYIVEYKVEESEHISMIQDVNVIIEHLSEDGNFTIN